MSLKLLCETEIAILNQIQKIYYFSPEEISKLLISRLRKGINKEIYEKLVEIFNVFIYFALSGKAIKIKNKISLFTVNMINSL